MKKQLVEDRNSISPHRLNNNGRDSSRRPLTRQVVVVVEKQTWRFSSSVWKINKNNQTSEGRKGRRRRRKAKKKESSASKTPEEIDWNSNQWATFHGSHSLKTLKKKKRRRNFLRSFVRSFHCLWNWTDKRQQNSNASRFWKKGNLFLVDDFN